MAVSQKAPANMEDDLLRKSELSQMLYGQCAHEPPQILGNNSHTEGVAHINNMFLLDLITNLMKRGDATTYEQEADKARTHRKYVGGHV